MAVPCSSSGAASWSGKPAARSPQGARAHLRALDRGTHADGRHRAAWLPRHRRARAFGLPGDVNRHFFQRFGAAILISVINGAVQGAVTSHNRGGTVIYNPSGSQDVLTEVLKSTVNIPPTVTKNQGDRIQVFVARDLDFRSVYELRNDTAASRAPERRPARAETAHLRARAQPARAAAASDTPGRDGAVHQSAGRGVRRDAEGWQRRALPFADFDWCRRLAKLVANSTRQRVDEESPLLSASLPSGERIQIVLPPATSAGTVSRSASGGRRMRSGRSMSSRSRRHFSRDAPRERDAR